MTSDRREGFFEAIFEHAATGIAVTDTDGRFLDVNPAFCRALRRTEHELLERDFWSVTHPDDRPADRERTDALVAGDIDRFVLEKRYLRGDGGVTWAHVTVTAVRRADRPAQLIAVIEDTTAHHEAADRLQSTEALRRMAGRVGRIGGWSLDTETLASYWSDEMYELLERTPPHPPTVEESLELYEEPWRTQITRGLIRCADDGTAFDMELPTRTYTGRPLWARVSAEAQRDDDGPIRRVNGVLQDITERRELTEQVVSIVESTTDAVYMLDRSWRFVYVNARAGELLERDPSDLLGRLAWQEFPDTVGSELHHAYERAMRDGASQVVSEYHLASVDRWFDVHVHPSPAGLSVYFQDVTSQREQRRRVAAQEEALARQARLLAQARDAIVEHRVSDGSVVYWNRGAAEMYGWPTDEAVGRRFDEVTGTTASEVRRVTDVVLRHDEWIGELTQSTREGAAVLGRSRWTLIRHDDGDTVLSITTDVTEVAQIEQQFLRAQRMESIGTLAGGIAHDLNNVLTPIVMAAELLRDEDDPTTRGELVDTIADGAQRGADMLRQVLSFARGVDGERTEVAVHELISSVERIARETFPRQIAITSDVEPDCPPVIGDPTQLHQVLLNLALNARDALESGGSLRFAARHEPASSDDGVGWVVVEVADDGVGMAPDVLARAFEPFFTTKPTGSGTGLGLSTANGIVDSHGGYLRAESTPGEGTVVAAYLPSVAAYEQARSSHPSNSAERRPPPAGDGELVLLVDDEPHVRDLARRALLGSGYRVVVAEDGEVGLRGFHELADQVAVVVTDMMMPVLDGSGMIAELRALRPDLPIVATSGLARHDDPGASPADAVLAKPYSADPLLRVVAQVLDARSPGRPPGGQPTAAGGAGTVTTGRGGSTPT